MKIKFKNLNIGDKFECYGDLFINYDYPKICLCVKESEDTAHEIDGVRFLVDPEDEVFIYEN